MHAMLQATIEWCVSSVCILMYRMGACLLACQEVFVRVRVKLCASLCMLSFLRRCVPSCVCACLRACVCVPACYIIKRLVFACISNTCI